MKIHFGNATGLFHLQSTKFHSTISKVCHKVDSINCSQWPHARCGFRRRGKRKPQRKDLYLKQET